MKTKIILSCLLLTCCVINLIAQEQLGMFIEVKRFLVDNNNTKFAIDYQVPYKNLIFRTRENSFFAELKVTLSISNEDSVIVSREFVNDIGVTRKYDVTTSNKSYLDRIALTLAQPDYKLDIRFEDINSGKSYLWTYETKQLDPADKLSDMELLSTISSDSLYFSKKFLRNQMIHIPEPSGLVSREIYDSVYIYCEAYGIESNNAKAVLTVLQNENPVLIKTYLFAKPGLFQPLLYPINISSMDIGSYLAIIELTDDNVTYSRSIEFIVTEQTEQQFFIFADPDDEYQLIRYIASTKSSASWKNMSKEAKRRYISSFWMGLAAMTNQTETSILDTYRERIDYCTARFSHFAPGWKSDMGRIYIRNGPPGDIEGDVESMTSSDETKFVRKDYQIWKYYGNNKAVYVFVDIQMNGNFKLIYSNNDEQESTYPDWRKYLGNDFDETRLEN